MTDELAIDRILAADPIELAARCFVTVFQWTDLGGEVQTSRIEAWLVQQYGKYRWSIPTRRAYRAVVLEFSLIYEQARIAARKTDGPLVLLPRGVRLRNAPDPVTALRELL